MNNCQTGPYELILPHRYHSCQRSHADGTLSSTGFRWGLIPLGWGGLDSSHPETRTTRPSGRRIKLFSYAALASTSYFLLSKVNRICLFTNTILPDFGSCCQEVCDENVKEPSHSALVLRIKSININWLIVISRSAPNVALSWQNPPWQTPRRSAILQTWNPARA